MQNYIIKGREAIRLAQRDNLTLNKYADPTEDAREGLTEDEALEVAREDASLIYCKVTPVGWTGPAEGYSVDQYFSGTPARYLGPDEDGVEPTFRDAE